MAVSNAMLAMVLSQGLAYFGLLMNKTRLYRLIGAAAMIAIGLASVMIEDSIPMFIFFGISAIVAGITLFEDVSSMVEG